MKNLIVWSGLCLVLGCSSISTTRAVASSVELVQSVPLETTLAVPGIRFTQEVWLQMINGAKSSLDLEEFYIASSPGQPLEAVLNAIEAAGERGVQVRILIDSKFYSTYPDDAKKLAQGSNIQVRTISFAATSGVQHSKYFVVDQSEAYVGSANFDWLSLIHIHEVGLHLMDSDLSGNLETIFSKDWALGSDIGSATVQLKKYHPTVSMRSSGLPGYEVFASPVNGNPNGISNTLDQLVSMIGSAKTSVKIQNYEYTTKDPYTTNQQNWTVLDTAIRQAAARGVHVQLLLDTTALKGGKKDINALKVIPNIEVRLVTIPQWSGGPLQYARLIHSKYLIVDESTGWVGSENLSFNYFFGCRNVGIGFSDSTLASQLGLIFAQVWRSTYASSKF